MWRKLLGKQKKEKEVATPTQPTSADVAQVIQNLQQGSKPQAKELVPAFEVPHLLNLDLAAIAKAKEIDWDAMESYKTSRYDDYPYFSSGLFGTLQPEDVGTTHLQSFYSQIPIESFTSRRDANWISIQSAGGGSFGLSLNYSSILSMKHNEVILR